ncbi:MAG: hypothetical protein RML40_05400, partial [Bacteroidota bacterium]|nr:hypothetical protein [Candidatus Kapabacteria bacterium]MDW8219949.1 hypothetical protein [Bacteroidota bacterium]
MNNTAEVSFGMFLYRVYIELATTSLINLLVMVCAVIVCWYLCVRMQVRAYRIVLIGSMMLLRMSVSLVAQQPSTLPEQNRSVPRYTVEDHIAPQPQKLQLLPYEQWQFIPY